MKRPGVSPVPVLVMLAVVGCLTPQWARQTSAARDLALGDPPSTSYMRSSKHVRRIPAATGRYHVRLNQVAPVLVCAVVKAEDVDFFDHGGVNWTATTSAVAAYAAGKPNAGGGSTITQQLARNLYLSPARTVTRKLQELWITLALEAELPKERVLELYLNVAEWGPGVWGVAEASGFYLGKPPAEVDAYEAALLASLLPAPAVELRGKRLRRALVTQQRVLAQLYGSGVLDQGEWIRAMQRGATVARALAADRTLRDALRMPADAELAPRSLPPRPVAASLPASDMLVSHCGRAWERRNEKLAFGHR